MALQGIPIPTPPRGFGTSVAEVVVDAANVLPADTEARLNAIAFDVHARSGGEIAVVTLPDLGGRDPSDIALRIGREWGVGSASAAGDRARNAGVLILLVPKETSADGRGYCRIEAGRGVEGFLLDADAGAICREATPLFQQRDYASALELVTVRVAQEFAREFGFVLDSTVASAPIITIPRRPESRPGRGGGVPPLVWLIVFFVLLSALGGSGKRGRRGRGGPSGCLPIFLPIGGGFGGGGSHGSWGGGGFGGGGFGGFGGGGGFSGGGGGSSW